MVERFRTAFVADVSDAVGQLYTMDTSIRPLYKPMKRLVGLALTVKAVPGDNLTVHGALNLAQAGDVLVVDWRGYTEGCGTGAGSMMPPISRGLARVIVDGGWRDIIELKRWTSPSTARRSRLLPAQKPPRRDQRAVRLRWVVVHAGDVIVGDKEGVVVVPRDYAKVIAESLREYSPRMSIDEWDLEQLKANAVTRGQYYEALFNARGGTYADWPGGPAPATDKAG